MATVRGQNRPVPIGRFDAVVQAHLRQARQRIRIVDVMAGLMGLVVGFLAYTFVLVLVDARWELAPGTRQLLLASYFLGALIYLALALVRPLCRTINPYYAARQVEQTIPEAKNSIVNWIDLHDEELPPVIHTAVAQRAAQDFAQADLEQAISGRRLMWLGGLTAILMVALIVSLLWLGGAPFLSLLRRTFTPFRDGMIATRTQLTLLRPTDGDAVVAVEQPVSIAVHVDGRIPDPDKPDALRLLFRYQPTDPYEEQLLTCESGREWATVLPGFRVNQGFWYKVAGGDTETPEYRVRVRSSPQVNSIEVVYHFPRYLHFEDAVSRDGNLKAYRGTEAEILIRTNRKIREGHIALEYSRDKKQIIAAKSVADHPQSMSCRLLMEQDGLYRISFVSEEGEQVVSPMPYRITVLRDLAPYVELTKPGQDGKLPEHGLLPLDGLASDDFGVKKLALHLRPVDGAELAPQVYQPRSPLQQPDGTYLRQVDYKDVLDLDRLKSSDGKPFVAVPGMVLEYWLTAWDNCEVPSSNRAESKHFKLTITATSPEQRQRHQSDRERATQERQRSADQQDQKQDGPSQPSPQSESGKQGTEPSQPEQRNQGQSDKSKAAASSSDKSSDKSDKKNEELLQRLRDELARQEKEQQGAKKDEEAKKNVSNQPGKQGSEKPSDSEPSKQGSEKPSDSDPNNQNQPGQSKQNQGASGSASSKPTARGENPAKPSNPQQSEGNGSKPPNESQNQANKANKPDGGADGQQNNSPAPSAEKKQEGPSDATKPKTGESDPKGNAKPQQGNAGKSGPPKPDQQNSGSKPDASQSGASDKPGQGQAGPDPNKNAGSPSDADSSGDKKPGTDRSPVANDKQTKPDDASPAGESKPEPGTDPAHAKPEPGSAPNQPGTDPAHAKPDPSATPSQPNSGKQPAAPHPGDSSPKDGAGNDQRSESGQGKSDSEKVPSASQNPKRGATTDGKDSNADMKDKARAEKPTPEDISRIEKELQKESADKNEAWQKVRDKLLDRQSGAKSKPQQPEQKTGTPEERETLQKYLDQLSRDPNKNSALRDSARRLAEKMRQENGVQQEKSDKQGAPETNNPTTTKQGNGSQGKPQPGGPQGKPTPNAPVPPEGEQGAPGKSANAPKTTRPSDQADKTPADHQGTMSKPGSGNRQSDGGSPSATPSSSGPANVEHQKRHGDLQLERVDAKMRQKLNISDADWKNFQQWLNQRQSLPTPDEKLPPTQQGNFTNQAARELQPSSSRNPAATRSGPTAGPPPEFWDVYRDFTRKSAEKK